MQRFLRLCLLMLLFTFAPQANAQNMRTTRALLVACSDFITQEDLGASTSGNLHMVGSALISADIGLGNLSIEDGTIGTIDALGAAIADAFSEADEDDQHDRDNDGGGPPLIAPMNQPPHRMDPSPLRLSPPKKPVRPG